MPEITLRDMTEAEFDEWHAGTLRAYAEAQVAAGNWTAEDAPELSRQDDAARLPEGHSTPGMLFLKGLLGDGTPVGVLWLALTHPRGIPDCAFIYKIEVEPAYRGAGHGRALLAAGEDLLRSHGVGAVELNVFGANTTALGLYATSGYRVVTQQMRKDLATTGDHPSPHREPAPG